MKTFEELGLSREFVSVLKKEGIITPSEIQEKAIPLVLAGKDVFGGSATGSGKTLAFMSGIIEKFEKKNYVQSIILTPTRELAEQIATASLKFSYHKKLKILSIYGGVDIEKQIRRIKNADIIVGTPGRILDHLKRGTLDLSKIKFLVLDEVDRMFDMGFKRDVESILNQCPKKRQTMLFSATISSDIEPLAKKHTENAIEVSVESHVDTSKLKQVYYDVPDGLKFSLFVHLLKKEKTDLAMVFCATRRNVDFVTNNLNNLGINAKAIHGGLNQNKRTKVLQEFNAKGGINVLICTDVAARGLDIPAVSHVYNYDLPKTSEDYIHRIGRTARAGKEGIAISILASRDYENFNVILRDKKLKIKELETPLVQRVRILVEQKSRRKNIDSRRRDPSKRRDNKRSSTNKRETNRNFSKNNNRKPNRRNFSNKTSKTNIKRNNFGKNSRRR
ncbi:MAG: DEAD/DEAH box helicase [Candidatus Pacearchaeota archaeon]|nr:DEAD/DEAH box helicase [Candidatus Pacearchaeota archaeon]